MAKIRRLAILRLKGNHRCEAASLGPLSGLAALCRSLILRKCTYVYCQCSQGLSTTSETTVRCRRACQSAVPPNLCRPANPHPRDLSPCPRAPWPDLETKCQMPPFLPTTVTPKRIFGRENPSQSSPDRPSTRACSSVSPVAPLMTKPRNDYKTPTATSTYAF